MTRVAVLYSGGRHWGGIESYLANLFTLYDRADIELLLFSLGDWELTHTVAQKGSASEVRLLSGKRLRLRTVCDIRRLMDDNGARLLVSQGNVANAYARLASLLTGVPHLTVIHSDMMLDYPQALSRWVYTLADRVLRPVTKHYIAVSSYLKEKAVDSGVRAESVRVVYNGVNTAVKRPMTVGGSSSGPKAEGGGQVDTVYVQAKREGEVSLASVGRLHPVKNFDALVRAMRLLPERVSLTIWGEGTERAELEGLVEDLDLGSRVRLPGESENMQQALQGVDIYLQPSKSEGCSFSVAEAMLQGKPVVVTPCGGLPEQVEDGVTGLVARDCSPEALAAAVETLVDDRGVALRLGRAAQLAAEEMYDMDKWLSQTTAALSAAASDPTHTR
jgi:glycosyltransferase involved in cell wall biosynthesis